MEIYKSNFFSFFIENQAVDGILAGLFIFVVFQVWTNTANNFGQLDNWHLVRVVGNWWLDDEKLMIARGL